MSGPDHIYTPILVFVHSDQTRPHHSTPPPPASASRRVHFFRGFAVRVRRGSPCLRSSGDGAGASVLLRSVCARARRTSRSERSADARGHGDGVRLSMVVRPGSEGGGWNRGCLRVLFARWHGLRLTKQASVVLHRVGCIRGRTGGVPGSRRGQQTQAAAGPAAAVGLPSIRLYAAGGHLCVVCCVRWVRREVVARVVVVTDGGPRSSLCEAVSGRWLWCLVCQCG